ncbi:hypothetical protein CRG98_015483 [Punica granatum]|uniref:SWIM-type domain-containing protein n=1 Tax=Punica granatum TaxID=22663 RepID=A0A2I0K6G3_PUNGR|nr:hypothetical protein CRG98_015483 [Punica granatum]
MVEFEHNMMIMKRMNQDAWAWLKRFNPNAWSKAGFSDYSKNDNSLNNTCEQFNSKIVKFREGYKFQVWKRPQCKVVDLGAGTCSCRMWQLTGIPCAHAIACMAYNNLEPEKYVHSWNDYEVGEENNLEGYDVNRQEDQFEYEGAEHVDSGVYWDEECILFNDDAEGHLGEEEEHLGDRSDSENEEEIVVRLSPTTVNMVISSDEEECYISEELVDKCISDDDNGEEELRKYPEFDENATFGEVQLQLHMLFTNLTMFKKAVTDYNVAIGRVFKFVKNDNERVRAKCRSEGCNWEIFCSWCNEVKTFKIKKFVEPHTCARGFKNKQANKKWLAAQLVDELRSYPTMSAHYAFEWFKRYRGIHVDDYKIYRAMKVARKIMEGSETLQYQKLWDYCEELRRRNPNSTFGLTVHRPTLELLPTFDRLYICFNANVQGFKEGCRPLIGLDGCFLKGYYGGQLLSAVTQDGNQHFYMIAIAVVA